MKLCITNNVSMSIVNQLNRLKTAKKMWDAIANQYESSGFVLNQQAIAQYIKINYADYDSINSFIMAFHNAVDMLNSLNGPTRFVASSIISIIGKRLISCMGRKTESCL